MHPGHLFAHSRFSLERVHFVVGADRRDAPIIYLPVRDSRLRGAFCSRCGSPRRTHLFAHSRFSLERVHLSLSRPPLRGGEKHLHLLRFANAYCGKRFIVLNFLFLNTLSVCYIFKLKGFIKICASYLLDMCHLSHR